ncbi:uncharacterized protein G2W53_037002 [Senna tora]|uniref:Uncharacterized protein n=1 Tax=Senna tora TaxID=362788 RepID=A0A834WAR2_9FABA|nr:uncharacterized protein G2W53_037002 [Senna tora]
MRDKRRWSRDKVVVPIFSYSQDTPISPLKHSVPWGP